MKGVLSLAALGIALAVAVPAFAEDAPTTKADWEKMEGMTWDEASGKCMKK